MYSWSELVSGLRGAEWAPLSAASSFWRGYKVPRNVAGTIPVPRHTIDGKAVWLRDNSLLLEANIFRAPSLEREFFVKHPRQRRPRLHKQTSTSSLWSPRSPLSLPEDLAIGPPISPLPAMPEDASTMEDEAQPTLALRDRQRHRRLRREVDILTSHTRRKAPQKLL